MSVLNDQFAAIGDAAVSKGIAVGVGLAQTGVTFAIALFGFYLAWRSVQLQIGANDSIAEWFGDVIEKLILFAIVMFLLNTSGIYQQMMQTWIWGAVMSLVEVVGNQGWSGGGGAKAAITTLSSSIDQFTDAMFEAYNKSMVQPSVWRPETWLSFLIVGAAVTIASVILFIAKAIVLVSFASGAVMFGIGAALGPMFIPLILLERFENFFWSWLRYLITSAMVLLVATVMIVILIGAMKPIIQPGGIAYSSIAVSSLTGLAVDSFKIAFFGIVVAIFMAYLLSQVTEIANALFSGNVSGIKSGAGAIPRGLRSAKAAGNAAAGTAAGKALLPSLSGGGRGGSTPPAGGGGKGGSPGGGGGAPGGAPGGGGGVGKAASGGAAAAAAATAVAAAAAATGATAARGMSMSGATVPNDSIPGKIASALDKAASQPDAGLFTKAMASAFVPGAGSPNPNAPLSGTVLGPEAEPPTPPTTAGLVADPVKSAKDVQDAEFEIVEPFDPRTSPAETINPGEPYKGEVAQVIRTPRLPSVRSPRRNRGQEDAAASFTDITDAGAGSQPTDVPPAAPQMPESRTGSIPTPSPQVTPTSRPPSADA